MTYLNGAWAHAERVFKSRIDEAKMLLEARGYTVVPKERVKVLSTEALLDRDTIGMAASADALIDHVKREMFVGMAHELAKVTPVEVFDIDVGWPQRRFRTKVKVIIPDTT